MYIKEIVLVALLATLEVVTGYGSGAPQGACDDMIPQHHVDPQTSPFPYKITVSKKNIKAGERVQVSITSGGSVKDFKGFFVQGRVGNRPVGKFDPAPGVKLVDCGTSKATGATHSKADAKDKIVLTWTAPPNLSETVRFRVTVAQNGGVFWVGHYSSPLAVKTK